MKFLVIGYGSIGKRHASNIRMLGHEVCLLRHSDINRNSEGFKEYFSLDEAVNAENGFDGAIICSPTSHHLPDVKKAITLNIPFLLEKPPASDLKSTLKMEEMIKETGFYKYDIAFNMRYYPVLQSIKDFLPNLGEIYSAGVYAGFYLPYWRKNVDYRETSSAYKELGGGVHIELSHEIDYILWFFGCPEKVIGYVNKISHLEISTEDICAAILRYQNGFIIELHLDYLSHKQSRGCQFTGENGTIEWNISDGKVLYYEKNKDVAREVYLLDSSYDFNETYIEELRNFIGIINGNTESRVNIKDGVNIMRIVEAIKMSSEKETWINLHSNFNNSGD